MHHLLKITSGRAEKSYISPPYFPMKPHSGMEPRTRPNPPARSPRRSGSSSSSSSGSSAASASSFASSMTEQEVESGQYDLRARALRIMTSLSGATVEPPMSDDLPKEQDNSQEALVDLIDQKISIQHDESPAVTGNRQALLEGWSKIRELNYETRIKEAVVDEMQRKVWVVSQLMKPQDIQDGQTTILVKERVDMMSFDWEGRLYAISDHYRRRRRSLDANED